MNRQGPVRRTLIFAALRWECRCVVRALRRVSRERWGSFAVWRGAGAAGEVVVVKTGIGPSRAEEATRAAAGRGRFDLCLSTGCAGALVADLGCGDAVLATQLADADGGRWPVEEVCRGPLREAAQRAALRTMVGPVLCSSRVLRTPEEKSLAAERTGAIAVEMEGIPVAAYAAAHGVPFASVRVVLDAAETSLDDSAGLIDPQTGAVRPVSLARSLLTGKSSWTSLRAMQQMLQTAEASLERLFAAHFSAR